jgi:hypothetical protein
LGEDYLAAIVYAMPHGGVELGLLFDREMLKKP